MSGPVPIKQTLAARAAALGFDACSVAPAGPAPHARAFEQWLAEGSVASMAWLERNTHRRVDPRNLLPGARSLILLAMNYCQPGAEPAASGAIARYAWGADYHPVIEPRLRQLDSWLTSLGGSQRCYVDTGPVLERDFAALAGLGWHGKSTMLISRHLGTWFFLASILTTLDLEPDAPARDHCGACTRCIDACPTGAIDRPYHLDSRLCISYLTIELKDSIPLHLRPLIGDRIYGCDDCLAACPWNRFAHAAREAAFAPLPRLSLLALLDLDDDSFRAHFRHSPIRRIKRRGLLRNVCVALGNTTGPEALPALHHAASSDPEPLIREHASWAIDQISARRGGEGE